MKYRISELEDKAKSRPAGYLDDVYSKGIIEGEFLKIRFKDHIELLKKYDPSRVAIRPPVTAANGKCCGQAPNKANGLGDWIERAVKPIAKGLKLGCLDASGSLRPESPCGKRKSWLNEAIPFN